MYLSRTLLLAAAALLTPAAAQAQTTLRVPVVSRTIFYLPAWTAEQQGFFKQEGLDVKLEVYDTSEKIFHDLRAGSHQIGMASIESVIAESYKGGKLKLVAGIAKRPPHFIVAQPEIKTLADLKGKKIGVVSMHEGTTFFVADIAQGRRLQARRRDGRGGRRLAGAGAPAQGAQDRHGPAALSAELRGRGAGLQQSRPDRQARPGLPVRLRDGRRNLGEGQPRCAGALPPGDAARHGIHVRASRQSAELGAKELRTSPAFARRALEDTVTMDIMSRDLSLPDASLRRVFDIMLQADALPRGTPYEPAKFLDDSYLAESRK